MTMLLVVVCDASSTAPFRRAVLRVADDWPAAAHVGTAGRS